MSAYTTGGTGPTPLKGAPGTFALKLGADGSSVEKPNANGCTTVTVENI